MLCMGSLRLLLQTLSRAWPCWNNCHIFKTCIFTDLNFVPRQSGLQDTSVSHEVSWEPKLMFSPVLSGDPLGPGSAQGHLRHWRWMHHPTPPAQSNRFRHRVPQGQLAPPGSRLQGW
eukprot:Skav200861  [mRNA]  locus=scaffold71:27827:29119:- [translate_table: standard]